MFDPSSRASISTQTMVQVRDLSLLARVGVNPGEMGCKQPLILTADLVLNATDVQTLSDTVDYCLVVAAAEELAERHIPLIETFARLLGDRCLEFASVRKVQIRVDKPYALDKGTASVSVCLER